MRATAALALALCGGCSLEAGVHGGYSRYLGENHGVWGGRVGANVHLPGSSFILGGEAEGAGVSESSAGARWTGGARVGLGTRPRPVRWSASFEAMLDGGGVFDEFSMRRAGYVGLTGQLAFWNWFSHGPDALNRGTWIGQLIPQLMLMIRARWFIDDTGPALQSWPEFVFGVGGRFRVMTDLL